MWFDTNKCHKGIDALKLYRAEWDENRKALKPNPVHDWTSHAADAMRYLCYALDREVGLAGVGGAKDGGQPTAMGCRGRDRRTFEGKSAAHVPALRSRPGQWRAESLRKLRRGIASNTRQNQHLVAYIL